MRCGHNLESLSLDNYLTLSKSINEIFCFVVQTKPPIGMTAWSSNLVVNYTNESASVNSTSISAAKHVVKMDLDDMEEGSCSSAGNNIDSPCSAVQESLTVSE